MDPKQIIKRQSWPEVLAIRLAVWGVGRRQPHAWSQRDRVVREWVDYINTRQAHPELVRGPRIQPYQNLRDETFGGRVIEAVEVDLMFPAACLCADLRLPLDLAQIVTNVYHTVDFLRPEDYTCLQNVVAAAVSEHRRRLGASF